MSTSGSLSTLLVQRLETALGVTLSAQGHLQAARSQQGILPTGQPPRIEATEDTTKAQAQGGSFQSVAKALQANPALQARASSAADAAGFLLQRGVTQPASSPPESTSTRWSTAARQLTQWLEHLPTQATPLRNPGNLPLIPQSPRVLLTYLGQGQHNTALSGSGTATANPPASANAQQAAPIIPRAEMMNALASSLFSSVIRQVLVREIGQAGLSYEATLWQTLKSNGNLASLAQHPKAILLKQQAASGPTLFAPSTGAEGAMPTLNGALANLVRQQLDAYQQQYIVWQGEAWQGAPMTWEIQKENASALPFFASPEEAGQESNTEANDTPSEETAHTGGTTPWTTTLTLDLPHLGKMRIQLQIVNEHIQAQYLLLDNPILKDRRSAASLLMERMPEFKQRLEALGLQPQGFEIFTEPSQPDPQQPPLEKVNENAF
ncbi:Flagellar hook-length control protein FliK [Oligella ureolytica]|uniref:Flagellar hook-length control protein FliK n=1 Tax=Oligella ureolytica TaxID=90244 RepID=A0A378XHJ2_9BURK|nr:flagellar hook-length control protein FliK [Oligella ureolytica]QPT39131.1 flagellar hook-length control protein FliK [Oligella ureolytica]SUA54897.1 Flagellar hook-length control protein FliK [Oligella ureolytica]